MKPDALFLLGLAAAAAGAINSVAGGGSLISWPAAVAAGLSQVTASATNTVALTPGSLASAWAYRRELGQGRRLTLLFCVPAAVGSLIGGLLLFAAPESVFENLVPVLVLGATVVLVVKDSLWKRAAEHTNPSRFRVGLVSAGVLLVAIYGGYFGAGIGILTLALLAAVRPNDIHALNAMKCVIAGVMNGVAAVYFVALGRAHLEAAAAMAVGSISGGFGGAALARRVDAGTVRWIVVGIGVLLSLLLAYRRWS